MRPEFGFSDATRVADYLRDLGVSHVYLSPILQAVPGSQHGYDVVDHTRLSAEMGGEEGFVELSDRLRALDLGAIADVVPNHMAAPTPLTLNAALWSVLADGPASPYAPWFDVDWGSQQGSLLMPVLGSPIDECLDRGEIALDRSGPDAVVRYFDHVFPVRDGTEDLPLEELLDAQHYRLAWWRVSDEELNYRRFFDVGTLVGLRMEDAAVFAETTAVLAMQVRDRRLDGLRIDHPDGMADPRGYLRRLNRATGGAWVVVEKIVEGDEELPEDWPCAGTTGYDALNAILGLLIDPAGEVPLTTFYRELTGTEQPFAGVLEDAKRQVLDTALAAEVARLAELAHEISQRELRLRDHTRRGLREALVELLVAFDRYRAYVIPGETAPPEAVEVVEQAAGRARQRLPELRHRDLDYLVGLALGRRGRDPQLDDFCVRFQQTCGPVMAKGAEDTAFYRYLRLVALNEVGGDPGTFARDADSFHALCERLSRDWPLTMTTLSTHDTKRSEDTRARIATLSEATPTWREAVRDWQARSVGYRTGALPDQATEYLIWQTLVGLLPPSGPLDPVRLRDYLQKATREAKVHTSWTAPDEQYETAVARFADQVLADEALMTSMRGFLDRLRPAVVANTLGQKLLALTMPGVPDVYQGCEVVDLSLVDPDNRRPVDFAARARLLGRLDEGFTPEATDLDAAKLLVTSRALRLRRRHPEYFGADSGYQRLTPSDPHAVGFLRSGRVAVLATRLALGLVEAGGWKDATVELPPGGWQDLLSGRSYEGGTRRLAELLHRLPVALLLREGDER